MWKEEEGKALLKEENNVDLKIQKKKGKDYFHKKRCGEREEGGRVRKYRSFCNLCVCVWRERERGVFL